LFRIGRPSDSEIRSYLAERADAPHTYPEVAATRDGREPLARALRGYDVDHHEALLGSGRELFARARRALLDWRGFGIPWLELCGGESPVAEGRVVATLTRAAGLWTLNACRVVYAIDEPQRAAFAYGTLPGHVEIGEERFQVTHDPASDAVRYEILAFSRPGHLLTRMGYLYARRIQRRFPRASVAALAQAAG
jgi:uncharacterized protein (UPF0548 family)